MSAFLNYIERTERAKAAAKGDQQAIQDILSNEPVGVMAQVKAINAEKDKKAAAEAAIINEANTRQATPFTYNPRVANIRGLSPFLAGLAGKFGYRPQPFGLAGTPGSGPTTAQSMALGQKLAPGVEAANMASMLGRRTVPVRREKDPSISAGDVVGAGGSEGRIRYAR